jgi:hypothetical protein
VHPSVADREPSTGEVASQGEVDPLAPSAIRSLATGSEKGSGEGRRGFVVVAAASPFLDGGTSGARPTTVALAACTAAPELVLALRRLDELRFDPKKNQLVKL